MHHTKKQKWKINQLDRLDYGEVQLNQLQHAECLFYFDFEPFI